jgi:hypothetical protein
MSLLSPPSDPPKVRVDDHDDAGRFRMRMTQVLATLATVVITIWFCTLGVLPGIIAVCTAKHVLVAILMMGLGVDAPRERR